MSGFHRSRSGLMTTGAISAVVFLSALTGCSSTSSDAGSAPAASSSVDSTALLKTAYQGVTAAPPTTPAKAPAGKSVWVVSCGQQVATCATPAASVAEAAKVIGWTPKVCDGKLNPAGWAACIRQGISAKVDVITVVGQDCSSFVAPLQEARKAGILTIGVGGNNCDTGGFDAVTEKLADTTQEQWYNKMGALQADWIIAKTQGKATVLSLQFTDTKLGQWVQDGFAGELKTCSGCKISKTLKIGNQDVAGGTLTTKFSTALLQDPTVNAVNVPLDGWFLAGLAQAVQSSGRSDKLSVIGAFGEPGNLDLIRQGTGEDATVAFSELWDGWTGIDTAVRLMNKQPLEPGGIGLQVIDKETSLPAAGAKFSYTPSIDFAAAYTKLWGV